MELKEKTWESENDLQKLREAHLKQVKPIREDENGNIILPASWYREEDDDYAALF